MNNNLFLMNEDEENQIDLTPMLDVVFIMLIFFIVTSTFVKESGVDVTRPNAETSVVSESNSIQIGITAANQVFIDKREVDKRTLKSLWLKTQVPPLLSLPIAIQTPVLLSK